MSNQSLNSVLLDVDSLHSNKPNFVEKPESRDSVLDNDFNDMLITNVEVIPQLENYLRDSDIRFKERPTIRSLHQSPTYNEIKAKNPDSSRNKGNEEQDKNKVDEKHKFGVFSMVYVPTFMNLLGTVFYLRMGWMTGEAGIILAVLQVLIGTAILCTTVLSMTAICTNGYIGSGGFYFMISRSLGPETGAMFGVLYYITNTIMVAFSIVGFCQQMQYILQTLKIGIVEYPSGYNDMRVVGLISLLVVFVIPFISLDFEAKSQWFLFGVVMISFLDFLIGELMPPNDYQRAHGFVGWNETVLRNNLLPHFDGSDFFGVFSIFTSSIAGDFTGATMSSTLKNPSVSIPKGSLLAIISSSTIYILQIVFFGSTVVRYATGNTSDLQFNNYTCYQNQNECNYGLINDQFVMWMTSALIKIGNKTHYIEPILAAGLLAQSLSSAMCSFIAAPKILQSLGSDKLLPLVKWFSKGSGKYNDPKRGYILTFIIALSFIAIADFDIIANIISNCYLSAWSLVNISCFHSDYVSSPSWRPKFKYFNKWISLLCGLVSIVLIFCFDWISSVCLVVIMILVWIMIYAYKPEVNWGQTTDSQLFKTLLSLAYRLNLKTDHVKCYRPSILLLSGVPTSRMHLISLADEITKHRGMLIVGDIVKNSLLYETRTKTIKTWNTWLRKQNIKCFYTLINAHTIGEGSNMLIQCCGLGSILRPNIVMIGFKESWKQCCTHEVIDYFNVIHHAFEMHNSIVIYRQHNNRVECSESKIIANKLKPTNNFVNWRTPQTVYNMNIQSISGSLDGLRAIRAVNKLEFIDVWWLFDDGGLTLLIPYILSKRKSWKNSKLRVFTIVDKQTDVILTEQNLSELLDKLRIPYHDLIVLKLPQRPTYKSIDVIIDDFDNNKDHIRPRFQSDNDPYLEISSEELTRFESETNKYLCISELLEEHSINSSLIIMTLQIPSKNLSAHLFMLWLDLLSTQMPDFLFVRGSQTNVLTFYSD